ncbi:PHD and RING finger domain-containing protein 1-like isoform X1 [Gadus macrocephalus]|uniref:PHD and RING finger domain-containing protein 1-like isoform X1 n=1 Tax=Gadus macrocephalus TaxID=80720 RepID=UPI0028CB726C|nr:PHD and RING finger domain-containing protein 1-like isoform X1 [Gadus macrocephalus]XP_059927410.1 PHD and RING finger domain-containing protein 1-like isoform X1 [Gadus macrocephalus]
MAEEVSSGPEPGPGAVDSNPAQNTCPVCLSPFSGQSVATLENCQHAFCLACILEWSKIANSCPVDRIAFEVVYQRSCLGGPIQKEIRVQRRRPDDDDGDGSERVAVNCEACGRSDRSHLLLVCTRCDSGYHVNCLTPQVSRPPGAVWSCPDCAALSPPNSASAKRKCLSGATEDEQVSDEELTELLLEAAGGQLTPSRLRPSTLGQPGRSTPPRIRHSQRIQNASGADARPAPPPFLHVPKYLMRATQPAESETSAAPNDGQEGDCLSSGAQRS